MTTTSASYVLRVHRSESIDELRPRVIELLKAEGFGILSEIDIAATLREKLNVERDPYLILGACNPSLANRAIEADPSIGALLPCNVVLREDGDGTTIEAMDPAAVMVLVDEPTVKAVAAEAQERLRRVIEALELEANR